jgi:hypothetical protein
MPRFLLPVAAPSANGALALALAALALVAAGCSHNGGHRASTATPVTPKSSAPCKLDKAQRRTVALARADIRRLRRIQAPVQRFSERGAPGQEALTGKFLLDLGSTKLPLNVFSRLLHQAKTATSLCGDCGSGLETEEPVLGNRGLSHGASCG